VFQKKFKLIPIALWFFFLLLPFMGLKKASIWTALIVVGTGISSVIHRLRQSGPLAEIGSYVEQIKTSPVFEGLKKYKNPMAIGIGIILFLLPMGMNNYYIDILTITGTYTLLALGLNIVVGMTGLLDLGYISFYAVGAYSYGILNTSFGLPFWPALLVGALLAALTGAFLGIVTLRLRGDYLAIVTLGFLMIVHLVLNNWDEVTGGPNGILGITRPAIGSFVFSRPIHFFYLILFLNILAIIVISRLNNSIIGRAWIAIREDEIAAQAMGINVTKMKILAFTLGASWAGLAGVFFAGRYSFISPESFTFFETVLVLSMVVLGGMGSIGGVILGAALLTILPEVFREFQDYRMLAFGGAMVLVMIFRPQGLIGNPRRKVELIEEYEEA